MSENINWKHKWYFKSCTVFSLFFVALWGLAAIADESYRHPLNIITALWVVLILVSVISQFTDGDGDDEE